MDQTRKRVLIKDSENNFSPKVQENVTPTPAHRKDSPKNKYKTSLKCLIILLSLILILALIIAFVCLLAFSSPNYPVSYSLPERPHMNSSVDVTSFKTSKILEGKIYGPEYLCLRNGKIYTGTGDGRVVEVDVETNEVREVAIIGKRSPSCGTYEGEMECGRPLGLEFDADGLLWVVDAYLGVFRVDVRTGLVNTVVSTANNPDLKLLNDLEITDNGEVYFTTSSIFDRRDFIQDVLMGATNGRLLKYDPISNEIVVEASNLAFPNGLLLSQFQDFLLISETTRARISKYNIRGINAGSTEVWVENLPCLPDNLQWSQRGTVLVACGGVRCEGCGVSIIDILGSMVWLRRLLQELPSTLLYPLHKPSSIILELSPENGDIIRVIRDQDGVVLRHASHVVESDDNKRMYVGSYKSDYIGVLHL